MLSVSTTWNFHRHGRLVPAIREIVTLGFEAVEIRAEGAVPDLEAGGRFCREFRVRCPSVHVPVTSGPWSDGDPSRHLASPDDARRKRAVASVLESLPCAAAARAEVLVLHLGEVEVERARERQRGWMAALSEGESPSDEVARALAERRGRRDAHLEAAARSLFDLTRAAPEVVWALEGRLYFHEIPDLEEVDLLISDAGEKHTAYWHDTGHAYMLGRVGVTAPLAWLDRHGKHTAGVHLHDALGGTDHLPPGAGEIDWVALRESLGSGTLRVLEIHRRHGPAELVQAADTLRTAGLT